MGQPPLQKRGSTVTAMANPGHLAKLKEGVEKWNQWRRDQILMHPDLTNADLAGVYLSHADFREVDLRCANLVEAELAEAELNRADLTGANQIGRASCRERV